MGKVVLIGPGAIGGTVGAAIAGNDRDRLAICARQEFDTLTLTRSTGEQAASHNVWLVTSPEGIGKAIPILRAHCPVVSL